MTALVFALVVALLIAAWGAWSFRRRAIERERRRVAALTAVAERLDGVPGSALAAREPAPRAPAPLREAEPGGRAALVAAVEVAVRQALAEDARLAVALVTSVDATTVADTARDVAETPVYVVGPRTVAIVLEGSGRAEALGVLARIQAACGATGRAVELEPREDAVELLARLLSPKVSD